MITKTNINCDLPLTGCKKNSSSLNVVQCKIVAAAHVVYHYKLLYISGLEIKCFSQEAQIK